MQFQYHSITSDKLSDQNNERIYHEFGLSDIYGANILLIERKENLLDLVKLEWTCFGMCGNFIYLSFF